MLGQIHPLVAKTYGIDAEVYCAELDFTGLMQQQQPEATYHPLPKYPAITRDLALVCDESCTVGQLEHCIAAAGGKLLRDIRFFDIYRGAGIAPGKKSVAFSLTLRADDRTLTVAESEEATQKILAHLQQELGAVLR